MVDDVSRDASLDDPLEEDERLKIVHIISVDHHVYQFIGQDRGDHKARDGDDHRL